MDSRTRIRRVYLYVSNRGMAMTGSVSSSNMVFKAMLKQGQGCVVGYFDTQAEIPIGWHQCPGMMDITDIMASMRCTKAEALVTMNAHWRR